MATYPVGDSNLLDNYPIIGSLDGTELIPIENKGTGKLYVPLSAVKGYANSLVDAVVITSSPYQVTSTDATLLINLTVPGLLTINMRAWSASAGGVYIKDISGTIGLYNVTINRAGTDLFEGGAASFTMATPYEGREFLPVLIGAQRTWIVK
jgi:hypothetical protein